MDNITILKQIQLEAESADVYHACTKAIQAMQEVEELRKKLRRSVMVPCKVGDTIYSIIGEKVKGYQVDSIRVDAEEIYLMADGISIRESLLGTYYFYSQELAQAEFDKKWKQKRCQ